MKWCQKYFFRIYMAVLVLIFGWSVLSNAQTTNTTTITTQPDGPVQAVTTEIKTGSTPALSFGLDKVPELQYRVLDIPLWQYLASAIYIVLAFCAAALFNYIVKVQLKKLTARTPIRLDDVVVELLHGPVKILALVVLLQFGLNLFEWPVWLEQWLKKAFYILLACSLTYMVLKVVDVVTKYWRDRPAIKSDKTFHDLLIPLASKTFKVFILVMAVLVTLDNLGFNIRTLLAGASIGGLALGLAAQDTVGNLFGAAAVFVDKPFKIGDRVQLNGLDGIVEEISLRSTRIRNLDGHLITIPNKTMGNATITNITRRPNIKTVMNIGITYDTPAPKVQKALEILTEVYKGHPMTHDAIIGFNQFADSSLNLLVVHWWKGLDYRGYIGGLQELNLTVKRRFDEAGISFAFPSRTVYLKQDQDWRVRLPQEGKSPREDLHPIIANTGSQSSEMSSA